MRFININNMIVKGDRIIVGVSGGPDSICLLHALHYLREKLNIEVIAAHVNHCIRGKTADEDEEYVLTFCDSNKIECHSIKIEVEEIAKAQNISTESAGRNARYDFFYQLMKDCNASKIAVAHNANDQAETVLMRLMRGAGSHGLSGIRAVRDGVVIRPLLNVKRQEIEDYCLENNLKARIDETNLQTIYARNKVRLELIPYIRENFNNDIINTLIRTSTSLAIDSDFMENEAREKFLNYCSIHKEKVIIAKEAFGLHKAMLVRIIRLAFIKLTGSLVNLEGVHIYDVIKIQSLGTGKELSLPNGILACNNYGDIQLKRISETPNKNVKEYLLKLGENNVDGYKVTIKELNNLSLNYENKYIKYFDMDEIKGRMMFRYRKEGDRMTPIGMKGSKKLKDIFIDLKVPKDERGKIPIICFNDKIAWLVGYKTSEEFKIDKATKAILEIKFESEEG